MTKSTLAAIPSQIGLVNVGNNKTYTSLIRYPGIHSVASMITTIQTHDAINFRSVAGFPRAQMTSCIKTIWKDNITGGQRIKEHKKRIKALGFDEKRAVFLF